MVRICIIILDSCLDLGNIVLRICICVTFGQNNKFISTIPHQQLTMLTYLIQYIGHCLNICVTFVMSILIIDLLQTIQIKKQHK